MKKLNADQWRNILYKFTSDEDIRPGLQKPFEQGGYICSTDAHVVLRVDKTLIPKSDDDYTPKGHVPNVAAVMPKPKPTFTISLIDLRSNLVALGLDYNRTTKDCPECYGSGDVDWYYTDRDGDTHTKIDECPYCEGVGEIHNGNDRYCTIGNKATLAYFLILTHFVMEALGADTLKCTWGRSSILLNIADGVDILVSAVPIPESKKTFSIKIEEL